MTTAVKLRAAGATDPGLERRNNEDRFHVDPQRGIFFVVDGVGGQAAGEVAAGIAHDLLRSRLERRTGTPEERVREAIALANREILQEAQATPAHAGMACVLTAVLVEDDSVTVGHVGDTRLYELRGRGLRQATHDHSPVGAMESEGRLTEAEAMRHPRRSEVYRDVGSAPHAPDDPDFIETLQFPLEPDAALLLCTDGLTDQVPSRQILRLVRAGGSDPEAAAMSLVEAANDAGGRDNVTAVLVFGEQFPNGALVPGARDSPSAPKVGGAPFDPGPQARHPLTSRPVIAAAALALGIAGTLLLSRTRAPQVPPAAAEDARTLVVGSTDAPFQTIAAALVGAKPGDVVEVRPGIYREEIALKDGVTLVSRPRREAVLEPSGIGAEPPIAVTAVSVREARLAGFVIRSAAERPLSVGVYLRDATVELDDLEITGAERAAVDISGSGQSVIRASDLHDNPGTGLVVRDGARPFVAHNLVVRNGTAPGGPGVEIQSGARPVLSGNVIAHNGAQEIWMPEPGDPTIADRNAFAIGGGHRGPRDRDPIRLVPPDEVAIPPR